MLKIYKILGYLDKDSHICGMKHLDRRTEKIWIRAQGEEDWGTTSYQDILRLFLENKIRVGNDCYFEYISEN